MASRSVLELLVRQKKEGRAIKDTEKEAKSLGQTVKKLGLGFAAFSGVALAAGIALKKAFDLGREGAVVEQTAESFDFLLEKVGAAPDLLDQLSDAARGTIDDVGLMSSTMTLLAGASGDLAPALAAATPKLLEIAKAANKLNPALGDTAFFYESIATGVKRAQPLILDNLGLTIKVGDANERFAEQLGITVEALTAEQKQLAILEDVFRAGDVIIAQVGGTTESATDSFDRLTTSLKNSTDQFKVNLFTGMQPFIVSAADTLDVTRALTDAFKDGTIIQEDYAGLMTKLRSGVLDAGEAMDFLNVLTGIQSEKMAAANLVVDGWQIGLLNAAEAGGELTGSLEDVNAAADGLTPLQQKFADARAEIDLARDASNRLWDSMNVGILSSIESLKGQIDFMQAGGLNVQSAFEEVKAALEAGLIAPEEAEQALADIELAAIAVQVATDEIDMEDAITQVEEGWNVGWERANELITNAGKFIDAIPAITEKKIEFFVEFTGAPLPGPGGQQGLDMIVPSGFPNDTFPIRASSGERVTITPPEITENFNLTINSQAQQEDLESNFDLLKAMKEGAS